MTRVVIAAVIACCITTTPAFAVQVLWVGGHTDVILDMSFAELEDPVGNIGDYYQLEWRDADYMPGTATPYKDWVNVGTGTPDGNANEVWLRGAGYSLRTTTTVPSPAVAIHLNGDQNDGLAYLWVDGCIKAQLDMGSVPSQQVCVIVYDLVWDTHMIQVDDAGAGQMGRDVAVLGACAVSETVIPVETETWGRIKSHFR